MMELTKAGTSGVLVINSISKRAFHSDIVVGASSKAGPPGYMSVSFHIKMAKTNHLYKLSVDGLIVGGAILFINGLQLNIGRIFVDPEYFRKGYGIFIMQEIERIFSDVKEIFLDTPVWNVRTNAFYQKLGYIEYKKDDEFIYYTKKMNNCELPGSIANEKKAEVMILKKISLDEFLRLRKLVHRSARPLDYTKWKFLFENGSCDDFLLVLSSYQNEDGGFGHNIECNNWNPNSSPYTVCIALDYLDTTGDYESDIKSNIIGGIVKYLSSRAYLLDDGWVGMQGIPSNNDFAHMPWFHFDSRKAAEADIGVTKRLADFILKYADEDSNIYCQAEGLKDWYRQCGQVLVNGYPDYDPVALNIEAFDPATYPSWLPLPVYFVASPESSFYPECRCTVDMNLDTIIDSLLSTHEFQLLSAEELDAYEQSNPHPDGKRWCVAEQTIGNYYWGSNFIIRDLDILRKFGRLDFDLPVLV